MTKLRALAIAATFALVTATGCSGDGSSETDTGGDVTADTDVADTGADAGPIDLFEEVWWPVGDESGLVELLDISPLFAEHDWLVLEASAWFDEVVHERPGAEASDSSWLGYYGAGNGTAFTFVGTAYPLNTLHELIGPNYQVHEKGYFSDFSATLRQGEDGLKHAHEWIWKPVKASIVATRMQADGSPVELDTLTFAPTGDVSEEARRAIVQVINVRNTGQATESDLRVAVQSWSAADATGDAWIEQLRDGDRMRARALEEGWELADSGFESAFPALLSPVFALEPGAERQLVMVYEFATDPAPVGAARDAVAAGWEALLDATRSWWKDWHDKGARITTPDTKLNDLMEGLKGTLKVQMTRAGAAVQLSHYTGVWHRDIYPPTRTLLKLGYFEDAEAIPSYLYKASRITGSIGNMIPADEDISGELPERDWLAAVPFTSERLLGEGPSFLPLMHLALWRYTGETQLLLDRWDYLIHAVRGQSVSDEGLIPFSGDETFRPPYAYNMGKTLEWDFAGRAYSAYSSYLFVVACEGLAAFIEESGLSEEKADDLAWLTERAAFVRDAVETRYWMEAENRYASMIYRATLTPEVKPSEDINTQPIWLGYQDAGEARALANLDGTMDALLQDNGLLQSIRGDDSELFGYEIGEGLMTGMAPGYWLFVAAEANLEVAAKTFETLGEYVSKSGNYPEVGLFTEPGRAINSIYDRAGLIGELWARFRLWEGAVNLEALWHYLMGYESDVPGGWMRLAPRLPHDAPFVRAERLPFGGARVDAEMSVTPEGWKLVVESDTDPAEVGLEEWRIRPTVARAPIAEVLVDGVVQEGDTVQVRQIAEQLSEITLVVPATGRELRVDIR